LAKKGGKHLSFKGPFTSLQMDTSELVVQFHSVRSLWCRDSIFTSNSIDSHYNFVVKIHRQNHLWK